MLFEHMSFATHRTWEMNLKVPFAKALTSWEKHYKISLNALHKQVEFSERLGYIFPSTTDGPHTQLPLGWLMLRRTDTHHGNIMVEIMAQDSQRIPWSPLAPRMQLLIAS